MAAGAMVRATTAAAAIVINLIPRASALHRNSKWQPWLSLLSPPKAC
jgi:hypothetical protein